MYKDKTYMYKDVSNVHKTMYKDKSNKHCLELKALWYVQQPPS